MSAFSAFYQIVGLEETAKSAFISGFSVSDHLVSYAKLIV